MKTNNLNGEFIQFPIGRDAVPPIPHPGIPGAPASIQLAMTEACPMRCVHCDLWKTKNQHLELDTKQWISVVDQLNSWLPHRHLHFTGGEPFLREDFLEVVGHAVNQCGFVVSANTSGVMLRESHLEAVAAAGFNGLIFSLDGMEERNGEIRGNPTVFARNLRHMEWLRHRMFITIATVILKQNLDQLSDLVRLAVHVGAAGIGFQPLFQNFGASPAEEWFNTSSIWPEADKAGRAIDEIIQLKEEGYPVLNTVSHLNLMKEYFASPVHLPQYHCLVGETNLAVSPYGEVRLCYQMAPIGNVKDTTLENLWNGHEASQRRATIDGCTRSCSIMNCNYNEV